MDVQGWDKWVSIRCVCLCVESIVYLLIILPRERLNWLNPYLVLLSRGGDGSNPHCRAPMLGETLNLSLPLEASAFQLRLLELCINVLSQQTPGQPGRKHTDQELEEYFFANWRLDWREYSFSFAVVALTKFFVQALVSGNKHLSVLGS